MNLATILHAPLTLLLIVITCVISIAAFNNPRLQDTLVMDMDAVVRRKELHRLATSAFVHGDPMHLFTNMLTLFFLGLPLEAVLGSANFGLVYFASLIAGAGWAFMEHFKDMSYRALGASGAVSGVTTVFALFAPFSLIFVSIVPVPAILFAAFYIGWSAYASRTVRDGVGHDAHLGGALMGLVLTCLIWPGVIERLVDQVRQFFA